MNHKPSYINEEPENILARFRIRSRQHRARMFLDNFKLSPETRILDLGGWNGSHIHAILEDSPISPSNVYVADIDERAVNEAAERFGFVPVVIPEIGRIPFSDKFFDIVFCSSVIEHVTIPKEDVWTLVSGRRFRDAAKQHQSEFANEIRRLGKGYFVQALIAGFRSKHTHGCLSLATCRADFRCRCSGLPTDSGSRKPFQTGIYPS